MSLEGIQDSQHTPTAALQTPGFADPQLTHNFPLNPEISLGDDQKHPATAVMEPHPQLHTSRFFLRIICALTVSSMCVVNSFMFSKGMILNATKLFLFFQRKEKNTVNRVATPICLTYNLNAPARNRSSSRWGVCLPLISKVFELKSFSVESCRTASGQPVSIQLVTALCFTICSMMDECYEATLTIQYTVGFLTTLCQITNPSCHCSSLTS